MTDLAQSRVPPTSYKYDPAGSACDHPSTKKHSHSHSHSHSKHLNENLLTPAEMSTPATSTTSLIQSSATWSRKDYANAFASLHTNYGFSGMPTVVSQSSIRPESTRRTEKYPAYPYTAAAAAPAVGAARDYSGAAADLQSSYGFGGAPMLPSGSTYPSR